MLFSPELQPGRSRANVVVAVTAGAIQQNSTEEKTRPPPLHEKDACATTHQIDSQAPEAAYNTASSSSVQECPAQ